MKLVIFPGTLYDHCNMYTCPRHTLSVLSWLTVLSTDITENSNKDNKFCLPHLKHSFLENSITDFSVSLRNILLNVHSIQGLRATQITGLLNEVAV